MGCIEPVSPDILGPPTRTSRQRVLPTKSSDRVSVIPQVSSCFQFCYAADEEYSYDIRVVGGMGTLLV